MRGIEVDSQRLRQLRRARGLTQKQLATRAGIAERTVRSAETGGRLRLSFLRYLAIALSVDVADVVHDRDELRTALLEESRLGHILGAIQHLVDERDMSEYLGLMAENIVINVPGPEEAGITGQYRGHDGVRTLGDRNREFLTYQRPPEMTDMRSSGNLVVISGTDCLQIVSTGKQVTMAWQHLYEFDKGRIVRLDAWADTSSIIWAFDPR